MKDTIIKALTWRYAVQVFDKTKSINEEDLKAILESARLSPSSFGIEAWKFIVVQNKDIRAQLQEAGYGQAKITDAAALVIVAYRTDVRERISEELVERVAKVQNQDILNLNGLKKMVDDSIAHRSDAELEGWIKAQSYIALGMMIETAALLGVDGGPMEGFSQDKVDEILGLKEKNLRSTSMLALGYRGEDSSASRKKVRRDFNEVVEFIK